MASLITGGLNPTAYFPAKKGGTIQLPLSQAMAFYTTGTITSPFPVPKAAPLPKAPPTVIQVATKAVPKTLTPPTTLRVEPLIMTPPKLAPVIPPPTDAGYRPRIPTPPPTTAPVNPVSVPATLPPATAATAPQLQSAMPGDTTSPALYYSPQSSGGGGTSITVAPAAAAPGISPYVWLGGAFVLFLALRGQ